MGTNPICWSSVKQKSVATSTMEAVLLFVLKRFYGLKTFCSSYLIIKSQLKFTPIIKQVKHVLRIGNYIQN